MTKKTKTLHKLSYRPWNRDELEWITTKLPSNRDDKLQPVAAVHGVNDDVAEKPIRQLSAGIALRPYQILAARWEIGEEECKAPIMSTIRLKLTSGRVRKKSVPLTDHRDVELIFYRQSPNIWRAWKAKVVGSKD
jgi:hypothetical protein